MLPCNAWRKHEDMTLQYDCMEQLEAAQAEEQVQLTHTER